MICGLDVECEFVEVTIVYKCYSIQCTIDNLLLCLSVCLFFLCLSVYECYFHWGPLCLLMTRGTIYSIASLNDLYSYWGYYNESSNGIAVVVVLLLWRSLKFVHSTSQREKEKEKERHTQIHTYSHSHTEVERESDRENEGRFKRDPPSAGIFSHLDSFWSELTLGLIIQPCVTHVAHLLVFAVA